MDENETVTPVIKINTKYGAVEFGSGENNGTIILRDSDSKWLLLDGSYEVTGTDVGELAEFSAYYEGNRAYVRLDESDAYAESVVGPEDGWYETNVTVYANTEQDGTGESYSWNLIVPPEY